MKYLDYLNLDPLRFRYIRILMWSDVQRIWSNEANNPDWQSFWENLGFSNWYDFRRRYIEPIKRLDKGWYLYQVLNPLILVPQFHGGPFHGWRDKFYDGQFLPTFSNMKTHPRAEEFLRSFPNRAVFIEWKTEYGLVTIDGMHHGATIAFAAQNGLPVDSEVFMAAAPCAFSEMPMLDFAE